MPNLIGRYLAGTACALLLTTSIASAALPTDDRFIAGYVAAILEREFNLADARVTVRNGGVVVEAEGLAGYSPNRIESALETVPGVNTVEIRLGEVAPAPVTPAEPSAEAGPIDSEQTESDPAEGGESNVPVSVAVGRDGVQILPRSTLFEPLRADPRWPHFSASYRYFDDDPDTEHVGAVGFGETLSLLRGKGLGGQWELDFQAGVFAIFDLDSESEDLINADYVVGLPIAYRYNDFSALFRVYHQSSHLGDEFILREDIEPDERINLSYEAASLLLSYDFGERWRVYGGGGYIFHRIPDSFDPGIAQAGIEYESETRYWEVLRPIAALDIQSWDQNGWNPDFSLRAGVRIGDPGILGQQLELTAEYYNGRNPNGQFFDRDLEYYGIGLHLYFN